MSAVLSAFDIVLVLKEEKARSSFITQIMHIHHREGVKSRQAPRTKGFTEHPTRAWLGLARVPLLSGFPGADRRLRGFEI